MLKIQVLGKGMIPRGYGLAPRKEFFKADLNLIQTILMTPGLKVNMLNPEDGKIIAVTNSNVKRLWDKYRSDNYKKPVVEVEKTEEPVEIKPENITAAPIESPTAVNTNMVKPVVKTEETKPVEESKPEITSVKPVEAAPAEEKVEEKKNETPSGIKPILNEDKNKNNNNNHHNNHKK